MRPAARFGALQGLAAALSQDRPRDGDRRTRWRAYAVTAGGVAAATGFGLVLHLFLASPNVALVFLTAVLISAVAYGLWPSLFASLLSVAAYNFFFRPPLYSATFDDPENIVAMFFFVVVAIVVSRLARDVARARLAAETDRLHSALLTSISHDLRTPLAAILGAATSLKTQPRSLDEAAKAEMIETIQEEAERLNRFIRNLLDMTRLESGAIVPHSNMVDISEVVGTALDRAGPILAAHEVEAQIPPDLPMIRLDAVLFEQVLFNLLDNAAKYSPAGSVVRVEAAWDSEAMRLRVLDEGEGIPEGDLERIFDKFHRVQATDRRRAGTGLGLAICRGFIEAMSGRIEAGNRPGGRGAVFTIALPVSGHAWPAAEEVR